MLRSLATELVLWFLPRQLREADADTLRRAKLCSAFLLTVFVQGVGFALILSALGSPLLGWIIGGATTLAFIPQIALRRTGSLKVTGNLTCGIATFFVVLCSWLEGGLGSPGIVWFPLTPMLATMIVGRRAGFAWAGVMVAALAGFFVLDQLGISGHFAPEGIRLVVLHLLLSASGVVLFTILAALFESLKIDALRSLEDANTALARARDEAEAATRAKGDILATMSHEIRTPIHGIFGMTELALDTVDDDERREFIHRSRACAETLLTVINDILDFSRIEAGKLVLERTAFEPRAVVDFVLDTLGTQATHKDLELIGWVDERVPARLLGDSGRLRQVLINLVGNAIKFTERGSVEITFELAADEGNTPESVVLRGTVRDTGIGIPRDKQALIFEAFAQVAGWTTSPYGGTGLGLAITKRLVQLMEGEVWLDSEPGNGSTFCFTVRVASAEAAAPTGARLEPSGLPVLVLDEGPASRAHLERMLRAFGACVTAPPDGMPPLLAFDERPPFAAVVAGLPVDGSEPAGLLLYAQALAERWRIPTVAVVSEKPGSTRSRRSGFAAVVTKPVKTRSLLDALNGLALQAAPEADCERPPREAPVADVASPR
jgi:signal transduction histidine kinase/CheY-like chemotaxis protein